MKNKYFIRKIAKYCFIFRIKLKHYFLEKLSTLLPNLHYGGAYTLLLSNSHYLPDLQNVKIVAEVGALLVVSTVFSVLRFLAELRPDVGRSAGSR